MSGKYVKKNAKKNRSLPILLVCAVILAALLLVVFWLQKEEVQPEEPAQEVITQPATEEIQETMTEPTEIEETAAELISLFDLEYNIKITKFIPYTGAFMEDRTDEVVTDVLGIQVTNTGDQYIQAMDITLSAGDTQAQFSLSTLFPGETMVVLEKNRMAYTTAPEFEQAQCSNIALFDGHPGMAQDKLEILCADGVMNITNISGEDITGDIMVYYKNYVSDVYLGGITYRIRIEGGLKAGELRQGMAAHFDANNSTIVFVTCG